MFVGGLDNCVKLWDTSVFEESGKDGLVVERYVGRVMDKPGGHHLDKPASCWPL